MSRIGQVYGVGQALFPLLPPPQLFANAPNSNQTNFDVGQVAYTGTSGSYTFYIYAGAGVWEEFIGPTFGVSSVTGTANQITATPTTGAVVLSLAGPYTPATYTAHGVLVGEGTGSIVATAVGATGTLLAGASGADPAFTASPSVSGSLTAGTTVTATLGNITATNGNLVLAAAGNKLQIHATTAGSDSVGTSASLDGASPSQLVVSTTAVTASSKIFLSYATAGGTQGSLSVGTIVPNTSFQIKSSANGDTSTVNYLIIN